MRTARRGRFIWLATSVAAILAIFGLAPGAASAAPPNGTYSGGPDVPVEGGEQWADFEVKDNRIVSGFITLNGYESCSTDPPSGPTHVGIATTSVSNVPIVNGGFTARIEVNGSDSGFPFTIVRTLTGVFSGAKLTGTLHQDRENTGPDDFVERCSIGPLAWTAVNDDPQPAAAKKCKKGFKRVKGKCKKKKKKR